MGYWGLLVLGLGLLIIVDYNSAWIVLLASLSIFLIFALAKRIFRENINRLLLPIFLIIIVAVFLFLNVTTRPGDVVMPQEQVLSQGISWKTAIGAATENIKSGFLGSGIGNYHYVFAKFKPVEFNQTWLWQIRFDRAGNHIAEIFGTMGFLGILSYLVLIGMFLLISGFLLKDVKGELKENKGIQLPLLMTFSALLVSQFVFYQNTTLAFAFWLVLGLGVVSWQKPHTIAEGELRGGPLKEKAISFKDFPELSLIFSTLVIILGIVILGLYYFGAKFYLADVNYDKGLGVLGEARIEKLEKAVSLNPRSPQYKVALSRAFLFEVFQELQKPPAQQDEERVGVMVSKSIDEAKRATELQPKSVVTWENLGIIYREIIGIAAGAADWSIKSFERAIDLEPTNPVLYTELGKLYLVGEDSQKAREYFQKALEKKSDYADALIQEALLLEREDILDEAIARLENLIAKDPGNLEAYFQLGRLYYNVGRIDQAIELFQAVTLWMPQHSNALYSLGVAYTAKGQTQEAILAFERVLELNPGNQDVIQKLRELQLD
ncbi:MAG: TPR repeat-containing protein YrrB [candidate division WS2 bacterium]|nr:TPR repeat-containing protein YrrB [Candidatus Psychracetigena formicireducens]